MVGRILRSADFERVLAKPPRARSAHFAAHHLAAVPSLPAKPARRGAVEVAAAELSTGHARSCPPPVDDLPGDAALPVASTVPAQPDGCWLGMVVPKKHARRAVTRNLIKRQMRAVADALAADPATPLPAGLWVLRLKAPFDRQRFASPASQALRDETRAELLQLLQRAGARLAPAPDRGRA